jgi:hypothetical protein
MGKFAGTAILVEVLNVDESPTRWNAVGGQQDGSMEGESVVADISDKADDIWGASLQVLSRAQIQCSGVVVNPDRDGLDFIRTKWSTGTSISARIYSDDLTNYWLGEFFVSDFQEFGTALGAGEYSFTLDNVGVVSWPSYETSATLYNNSTGHRNTSSNSIDGAVDSARFLASFWLRPVNGFGTSLNYIFDMTDKFTASPFTVHNSIDYDHDNNHLIFDFTDSAGVTVFHIESAGLTEDVWHHCLLSFDLDTVGSTRFYIDNTDTGIAPSTFTQGAVVDWTSVDALGFSVAAGDDPDNAGFTGCLSEFWLDLGQYLNAHLSSNRQKFISADGKAVYLGSLGTVPTGVRPAFYFDNGTTSNTGYAGISTGGSTSGVCADTVVQLP